MAQPQSIVYLGLSHSGSQRYYFIALGSVADPLGMMPPAAAIAGAATLTAATATSAPTAAAVSSQASMATPWLLLGPQPAAQGAVILSSALPPIGAKLANKIRSKQFVAMKELLADKMVLQGHLEHHPSQAAPTAPPPGDRFSSDMGLLFSCLRGCLDKGH